LRSEVKKVLLEMGDDRSTKPQLAHALVERFVPVSDSGYDEIRRMLALVEAAQILPDSGAAGRDCHIVLSEDRNSPALPGLGRLTACGPGHPGAGAPSQCAPGRSAAPA
jgi:hypothetical protein